MNAARDRLIKAMAQAIADADGPEGPSYEHLAAAAMRALSATLPELGLTQPMPTKADWNMQCAAIDTDPHKLGCIGPLGFRISPQMMFERCWSAMIAAAPDVLAP